MDPRFYQIAFLSSFLALGVVFRDFRVGWLEVFVAVGAAVATQAGAIVIWKLSWKSLRSALISSLGLLMLIRTPSLPLLGLASSLAILSKFTFRYCGKHFFNPTNFALACLLLLSPNVWISPAQWGEEFLLAAWIGILGVVVTHRSLRSDISYSFLGWYLLFLFLRVSYLNQPISVFFHQLKSGSLILFSFFMISDPKSTPDHRYGRVLFSGLVAALAYFIKFKLFNPNALVLALFFLSPITPVIDKLLPGQRFEWFKEPRSENENSAMDNPRSFLLSFPSLGFLRLLRR